MAPIRVPALAIALASVALPAGAQTTNPLGGGLPLSIHAQTGCFENLGGVDQHVGASSASCAAGTSAVASADLSSGKLRVTVISGTGGGGLQDGGIGKAAFYDTLTFSGFTGFITIPVNMSVHGSFAGLSGGSDVFASLISTSLPVGFHLHEGSGGELYFPDAPTGTVTTNADPVTHLFPRGDVRIDMSRTFAVSAGEPVWFLASLNVFSGQGNVVIDFGHTAQLSLDLPPGVTFTSTSGVFLTDVAAPVPEPETAWLLVAGVLPLLARLRRRQTTVCASSPCA